MGVVYARRLTERILLESKEEEEEEEEEEKKKGLLEMNAMVLSCY